MNIDKILDFISGNLQHSPNAPKFNEVVSANTPMIVFLIIICIALIIGKYALGTKILGKKDAIKTIIPFYGLMLLFKAVDLNSWLAITCYIPVVGIIPYAIFSFNVPKAFGQKIEHQILSVFFPYVFFNVLGFSPKYEYQYVKGKNVAFKNEFRTVMPEDLGPNIATPAEVMKGAAVGQTAVAKESMISRAASAAAEQTRIILEKQEKQAAEEEAKKKAEEEAKKQESAKQKSEEYNYDIFSGDDVDTGPDTASLNIEFKVVNGRFQSAPNPPKNQ